MKQKNSVLYFRITAAVYFILLLAIPVYQVIHHYDILNTGKIYKFIAEPYDPYDPFRGRYVEIHVPGIDTYPDAPYALLAMDENGFSYAASYQETAPENPQTAYVKNLQINRYYLNENKAPKVELFQSNPSEEDEIYVQIAVKNGNYVIEGMYINDIRVENIQFLP